MFSVLLWKEYREHRMVWAVLAFAGAATVWGVSSMAAAGWLGAAPDTHERLAMIAVFMVGFYALICGAMMFAGERENGTLSYLDALPGYRRRLWQGKFLAGVLFVLGQIILFMGLGAAISLFENWSEAAMTLAGMVVAGLYGLAWGMLFSSFGRSVMNMILLSVAGQVAWLFIIGLLALIFAVLVSVISGIGPIVNPGWYWASFFILTVPAAFLGSALVFTRLDRRRLHAVPESLTIRRRMIDFSWPMLFWLTWRQARGFAAGIAVFALLLGFLVPLNGLILWPVATLVVGVLCGATAFADEQTGSFRFLGDQRLPLGLLWLVKVGLRFGVAVAGAFLVLAPSLVIELANVFGPHFNPNPPHNFFAHVFHSDLLGDLCPPGLFLTMWLIYGFSAGCLYGLLFRHGLASGVFALFTSALTTALWIPSLLGGGLHAWQVFGPPVLVLLSTRLLMRPWAAGRMASWTTAVRLTPFVVLSGLWIAGGLWYRVLEVPYVPMKTDLDAFRASLPTPERDGGGQLFRSACLRFEALRLQLQSEQGLQGGAMGMAPGQPLAPGPLAGKAPVLTPFERASDALTQGWPADDHVLAAWLDKLYAGEWPAMLKKAADLPTGPFDDVRNMTQLDFDSLKATQPARELAVILAARGLQRQAAGDNEAYVENLRVGLSLSRSMRDHTPGIDVIVARVFDAILLGGLDRWLEKLHGRSDLIYKALEFLSQHLKETADDGKDQEMIEQLILKNTADNPLPFLQIYMEDASGPGPRNDSRVREEAEWVVMAWLVPWERARQGRILRVIFEGSPNQYHWLYEPARGFGPLPRLSPSGYATNILAKPDRLCAARAMLLKLALRQYQADDGKPANNLEELVPKYLPSVPLDPYGGAPFHYRLSQGEEIEWPDAEEAAATAGMGPPGMFPPAPPPMRKIPAGQGVLWSVGQDGTDDGGHRQSNSPKGQTAPGQDFIFLVPLPPKTK